MITPYGWLKESAHKYFFGFLTIINIVLVGIFAFIDQFLKNQIALRGIISFELAGSESQAKAIVESWNNYSRDVALFSLGLDYLFLFTYSLGLSFFCYLLATKNFSINNSFYKLGIMISWVVLLTGVFDGLENYALLQILLFANYTFWPILAKYFAIAKFTLLALSLFYIIIGVIAKLKTLFTNK